MEISTPESYSIMWSKIWLKWRETTIKVFKKELEMFFVMNYEQQNVWVHRNVRNENLNILAQMSIFHCIKIWFFPACPSLHPWTRKIRKIVYVIILPLLPLSVTRRDKIHEGVNRVLREILGVLKGVRKKFRSVENDFWFMRVQSTPRFFVLFPKVLVRNFWCSKFILHSVGEIF